jgi:hypothetical protein
MEGFNKLSSLPSIQGQLTLYGFIFRNQKSLLKVIIIPSNPRHIVCSCKQLLIIGNNYLVFQCIGVYNWCKSVMIIFNLLKCCIGIFVPRTKFAWRHQALCNSRQGIFVVTMVDDTIQTNWNVTFYIQGIYNRLVSCKNDNKKQFWYIQKDV